MSQPRSPARRRLRPWDCLFAALLVVAVSVPVVLIKAALPARVPTPGSGSQASGHHGFQVVGRLRGLGDLVAGDGTYPVPLPDGRTAWLLGDCRFRTAGGVAGVRNAILLQDAHRRFRIVTGRCRGRRARSTAARSPGATPCSSTVRTSTPTATSSRTTALPTSPTWPASPWAGRPATGSSGTAAASSRTRATPRRSAAVTAPS